MLIHPAVMKEEGVFFEVGPLNEVWSYRPCINNTHEASSESQPRVQDSKTLAGQSV